MLRQPTIAQLRATAALLTIPLKDAPTPTGKWELNENQLRVAEALITGQRLAVYKIRQEGITSVCLLWLLLLAVKNPGLRFGFVLQDEAKARDKLDETVKAWLPQLGMPATGSSTRIYLPNGSAIFGISARGGEAEGSESAVARSGALAACILSEAAYYPNDKVFPAIDAAVGRGPVVMESTASGPAGLFAKAVQAKGGAWDVLFLGVETVTTGRLERDPKDIDDDEWETAQAAYGLSSRTHAAWWVRKLEELGGDVIAMKRDYPVRPSDPFDVDESRWIQRTPPRLVPIEVTASGVEIYSHLHPMYPYKQRTIMTVDPSAGVGGDHCSAWVLDRETHRPLAGRWSNDEPADVFTPHVVEMHRLFKPDTLLLETNGVGEAHLVEYRKAGLTPNPVVADRPEKHRKLLLAKRYVEAAETVPQLLREEADSLRVKVKDKPTTTTDHEWIGRKDGLISLGQGLLWLERNPWAPEPERSERNYWDLVGQAEDNYYGG